MKNGSNKCLIAFSSLILAGLLLEIINIVLVFSTGYISIALALLSSLVYLTSIIGTFVSSIVCLCIFKKFSDSIYQKFVKKLKTAAIVGLVGSSILILVLFINLFIQSIITSILLLASGILLIVTFGISISASRAFRIVKLDPQLNNKTKQNDEVKAIDEIVDKISTIDKK